MSDLRPDVPPLSDLGRQRIRQAVFDRLDREPPAIAPVAQPAHRRRAAVLIAVAAAAAVLAALVAVEGFGGDRPEAAARQPSPSRLETGATPSQITVGDARITAGPHAALTVNQAGAAGVQIFIERGAIEFAVAPRGERPPFVVLAADVRVEVVGTVFTVARDGDDVSVAVARGVVRVIRAGEEEARVAAGQSWPPAAAAAAPASASEPELTFEPEPAATAGRAKRRKDAPPPQQPDQSPAAAAATPRERYETAAAAEPSRPEEALAAYRALAAEGGAWADNALFAQASLELKLGRKQAARRSLAAYLKRYPRGANAGLARALLDGLP